MSRGCIGGQNRNRHCAITYKNKRNSHILSACKSNCVFLYISSSTMTKKQCKLQDWLIGGFASSVSVLNPSRLRNKASG
jgi:hypothetical protein